MKKFTFISVLLFLTLRTLAQPFSVGSTTITFTDPSRSNRAIETDIYYPANAAGSNVSVANGQFPVIAFGHGFVMNVSAYQNIWSALVPQGYIVALPKTEGSILPNHTNFGRDLAFVISALQQAGTTSGNLFNGRISATSAVMGHSMGGGAAMLSVQYNPSITAVAGLAPAETNPSASGAAQQVNLPALVLAGGNDCVTPAAQHSRLIYDNINSDCKWYLSINGGSHCQFANQNFNCSFGESTCSPPPAISRSLQQAIANEFLLPWLNFELKGNCNPWINKQSTINGDSRLTAVSSCKIASLCPAPSGRNVSNIKSNSVQFNWSGSDCGNSYEVRYRKTGTTTWVRKSSTGTNRVVYSLTPGTTYEWQVRSVCDSTASVRSGWGTIRNFTTAANRIGEQSASAVASLTVFPNPGDGLIHLNGEGISGATAPVVILNAIGQPVYSNTISIEEGDLSTTMDLRFLPRGVYFLQIVSSDQSIVKRLIIQ
jgi:predicted dienelactone hydrolase